MTSKLLLTTLELTAIATAAATVTNIHIIKSTKKSIIRDYSNSAVINEESAVKVN